jgi:hypothetical protein
MHFNIILLPTPIYQTWSFLYRLWYWSCVRIPHLYSRGIKEKFSSVNIEMLDGLDDSCSTVLQYRARLCHRIPRIRPTSEKNRIYKWKITIKENGEVPCSQPRASSQVEPPSAFPRTRCNWRGDDVKLFFPHIQRERGEIELFRHLLLPRTTASSKSRNYSRANKFCNDDFVQLLYSVI